MNEKKLNLIGLIIKIVIIAPALIAGFVVMGSGVNANSDADVQAAFMDSVSFNAVINISYITIVAAVILVLAFFAVLLGTRPMDAIRSILGIILAGVVFFILYSIGTADTSESLNLGGGLSVEQGAVDFAHAGIITALLAITICGVLALFLGYVMKLVRKI
jgi:hypothetical protein